MTSPPWLEVVVATANAHKVREIHDLLRMEWIHLRAWGDFAPLPEVVEDGATFAENALIKAHAAHAHTRLPALADDSGIEIDCLDGRPGIYSARFARPTATDAENNAQMVRLLADQPPPYTARYRCVIALTGLGDQKDHLFEGSCEGSLILAPRGQAGFGYDPYFVPHGLTTTFAEMTLAAKQALSHRGAAVRKLAAFLAGRRP
ncbi:MAG: non-canonical purine NTP pyrophosphatase, RdgB/HAM1 family [Nitrospirae bacterium CG18_big_fil_WC_8_21_14_2_50_70_55]|nr:RdgB/HAM1 family non-canonical purine NTP pyrophosphatase [Deltaproteobacteria bacterium]OIP63280.1 MAG: non-canonical purine NTP pyrophosphatase, RdgB/HAM1 family [Nitrospirae bacterium CG2_30_70_394]PIQ06646.1 MAG: non-canonical purine NTP pyrophosphatase, RdgB/HAM1 family [Nitrospirae bacterium CG18_big_fil_WC_8_21_14_2_50_70_55]PIU78428.1 MAG: non-canonical purine NTP pyrophosphatase, RdgB/HAM1 family [Nitrospirae bacterium CG06_land_8_20_14_3_00_70_43]PIW84041.1 MAG: non-canonical purin